MSKRDQKKQKKLTKACSGSASESTQAKETSSTKACGGRCK